MMPVGVNRDHPLIGNGYNPSESENDMKKNYAITVKVEGRDEATMDRDIQTWIEFENAKNVKLNSTKFHFMMDEVGTEEDERWDGMS